MITISRRALVGFTVATGLLASVGAGAQTSGFVPKQAVKVVVPFTAGGATDVLARIVGERLSQIWKQAVIIENVPGATGAIGATQVARAEPDGYTLLVGTASVNAVLPSVKSNLQFDTLRDFQAVSLLATFPNVLVIRPDLPAKNTRELINLLKNEPGKYNFASSGFGSSIHLAGELFKLQTNTDMTHVSYKGSAPAITDLLGGHVDLMFDNMTNVLPYIQDGKLRAIGVASLERTPFAPEIPAIAEVLPGFEATSWIGFLVPAKTPGDVVQRIANDVRRVMQEPQIIEKLAKLASAPGGNTPEEFAAFIKNDVEKWRRVVKEANLKVE